MMATMQSLILGSLAMIMVITGMMYIASDWYQHAGVTNPLESVKTNAAGNASSSFKYTENWANQTATSLANAQAIPFFGGSFMLLTGVFQSLTLLVGFLPNVAIPLFNFVIYTLPFPGWFSAFVFASLLIVCIIALLHAMGGGGA